MTPWLLVLWPLAALVLALVAGPCIGLADRVERAGHARSESTHGSTHAPLQRNVTHGTCTGVTFDGITAGQGQSRAQHTTHAPGACTIPPPSLQGGIVRPHLDSGR